MNDNGANDEMLLALFVVIERMIWMRIVVNAGHTKMGKGIGC